MGTTYTDPNAVQRREINVANLAGAAGASMAKFLMFQKTKLKKVHCLVVTAGTNAAAQVDIFNGTTSVGSIVVGTNTAGSVLHSGALDSDVTDNGLIELKGAANTATFVGSFAIEHQVYHDATQS
jgi:hypothetical protein